MSASLEAKGMSTVVMEVAEDTVERMQGSSVLWSTHTSCCDEALIGVSTQSFLVLDLWSRLFLALGVLSRDPLGRPNLLGRYCQGCDIMA